MFFDLTANLRSSSLIKVHAFTSYPEVTEVSCDSSSLMFRSRKPSAASFLERVFADFAVEWHAADRILEELYIDGKKSSYFKLPTDQRCMCLTIDRKNPLGADRVRITKGETRVLIERVIPLHHIW